ncbi:hypothetical protein QOZ80_1AG0036110 [Eleusine coracana subsp. coracana]|nr:hypothetical protein QOZ80_1AG0036110 [Eleusine coracana subsp. coracana]
MVTGGALSNVLYTVFLRGPEPGGESLIDYDVVVASQPCLLLGVSVGVVCNVVLPEWLVTALFIVFLAFTTFKTYRTGIKRWRAETVEMQEGEDDVDRGTKEALLLGRRAAGGGRQCRWVDMAVLVMIWLCFFVVHLLVGGKGAKGAVDIKPCGVLYWLITLAQIPVAVAFTACIVHQKRKPSRTQNGLVIVDETQAVPVKSRLNALPAYVFPVAALLTGVMSGLFGIGGGLLLNPVFYHIGVPPKTSSATVMFMVLFSSSMSTVQFIILGVSGIESALAYAVVCFVASVVGLVVIEGAIRRSGRVSLIVFAVAIIMALSAAVIACSGAVRVWAQYASGQDMGFKLPC